MNSNLHRGFTLLEIMVVVFLIGLAVTIVALSIQRDVDQLAQLEARRFAALIEHIRDETTLTGRTYAVQVNEQDGSYQFLTPGETWTPVTDDDLFRTRVFPEPLQVRLDLLDTKKSEHNFVVIQGLGEITPFALTVMGDEHDFVVTVDAAQNVSVQNRDREAG